MELPVVPHPPALIVKSMSYAMIPLLSHELFATAVQMVCYFCTAVVLVLSLLVAPRG